MAELTYKSVEVVQVTWVPTNELRYEKKQGKKKLQQKWVNKSTKEEAWRYISIVNK